MAERGSLDLLGPSTKRAVAAVLAGVPPEEAGAAGATNGAAMRIAPVGIAVRVIDPGARPPLPPSPQHSLSHGTLYAAAPPAHSCRPWSTAW